MNKINKYKCEYCIKNYMVSTLCKGYEKKCLYNPNTRNCGSCLYLVRELILKIKDANIYINSCFVNCDLSPILKSKCSKYVNHKTKTDAEVMNALTKAFDRRCSLSYYILDRMPINEMVKEQDAL